MPEPPVFYIAGFNTGKNSGRSKATREKAAALQGALGAGRFSFLFPAASRWRAVAYLKVACFDLKMLFRLLFVDKNARIIQRTTFLPLTNIYLWMRGVHLIYELHTDFADEIKHYQVGVFEKTILHGYVFFERLNLRLASGIIYNHPTLQEVMGRRYRKPSIFTYNGANVQDFLPMDKYACRSYLGLAGDRTYYVFVGSVTKWRGVDLLVDIFNKYMSADEVLLIVGDASHIYGRDVSSRASGNTVFVEEVEASEAVKYINAADVCLLPVKPILTSPGNPLKLYDYIACGKPVIGQENVIGCADEIQKYDVGIVTDFYNGARAATEMREFIFRHNAQHYTQHNRHVAVIDISWQKRMEKWIAWQRELPDLNCFRFGRRK